MLIKDLCLNLSSQFSRPRDASEAGHPVLLRKRNAWEPGVMKRNSEEALMLAVLAGVRIK